MSSHWPRRRESTVIWLAIVTAIVVALYRIAVAFADRGLFLFQAYAFLPVEDWVTNLLIFWSLALLFAACRFWRRAAGRQKELENVIGSLSPDVLLVVDAQRTITMCNPAAKAMFGYEPAEIVGHKTELLYGDRRVHPGQRDVYNSLERFGFHIGFATGRRKTGETFPLEIMTGSRDASPGAVVLIRDISERKRAEEHILRAKEAAETANRIKSDVLAELAQNYARLKELEELRDNLTHMIVHDMKNLLFGISGNLEMLQREAAKGRLSPEQVQWTAGALDFTTDLVQMVKSLLDISRMEAGEMPLDKAPCDMGALIAETVERLGPRGQSKALHLVWSPTSLTVPCDRDVVSRILMNIAGNAVRFSPERGRIEFTCRREGNRAVISIADEGPGIPAQYHQRIFQKFGRLDGGRRDEPGREYSTGLGLTFCKLAVEAHGGQIGVVSDAGSGSLFWFALPLEP